MKKFITPVSIVWLLYVGYSAFKSIGNYTENAGFIQGLFIGSLIVLGFINYQLHATRYGSDEKYTLFGINAIAIISAIVMVLGICYIFLLSTPYTRSLVIIGCLIPAFLFVCVWMSGD